ncbi:MAG: rhomboid family intramembrane serine protease [Bacteroidales bacterium]
MNNYSPQRFSTLPPVIKNLLIINGLFFLATLSIGQVSGVDLVDVLGLHYPASEYFRPYQFITYMFMHGSFTHIFFNMFALWMFGNVLENIWGPKRFLAYYLITGVGAALTHMIVTYFRILSVKEGLPQELIDIVYAEGATLIQNGRNYTDEGMGALNILINTPTVGASGSVFGILLAFGMMFPNSLIYLYFFIPVKAKYFVIGYGLLELFSGVMDQPGDNVAHFAHLGGMVFGIGMIYYWQYKKNIHKYLSNFFGKDQDYI